MSGPDYLGLVAGALSTTSLVPQVIKTWKSKSAKDLSLGMFSLFTLGISLWLVYGIINKEIAIIISNTVTLVLSLTLIIFKFKFGAN